MSLLRASRPDFVFRPRRPILALLSGGEFWVWERNSYKDALLQRPIMPLMLYSVYEKRLK